MPTEFEYVIKPDGTYRRDINMRPIKVDEGITATFTAGLVRKCPSVAIIGGDYGRCGVAMLDNYEFWSVRVHHMGLAARFSLDEGIHTPDFLSKDKPVLPIKWKPTMPVIMAVTVMRHPGYLVGGDHYLIALDAKGNHWRLPVSNVSDVGKLCHGQEARRFNESLDCVRFSCEMFSKSSWNSDWYDTATHTQLADSTRRLFRFKPTEQGFEQLEPRLASGKDWTSLCSKIAVDNLNKLVQLV